MPNPPAMLLGVRSVASRLSEGFRAFAEVYRNRALRRLQLAAVGSIVGQFAFGIGLAVYAYQAGGAKAVGVIAVIRTVPAAFCAPFVSVLADRYRRRRVMIGSDLVRATLIGGAAIAAYADVSYWVVFALAGFARIASTAFRPAEGALLPTLARSPQELTAANVSAGMIDSVGIFAGPALGGLLLAATQPAAVFVATVCTYCWSAFMLALIPGDAEPAAKRREGHGFFRESTAGFREIVRTPGLRLIVALYSAQTIVAGAEGVLIVVAALDLLDVGNAGLGFLNSASGIGGLVGALVVLALAARKQIASDFGLGVALFGLPLVAIGLWPNAVVAVLMLGVLGLGNTMTDVGAYTLLQRIASDEVLGRVFGVMHSALVGTMGIGAILAPLLIDAVGIRTSLVVTGAFLPLVSGLLFVRLRAVDRAAAVPERELAFLRAIPIFGPLPLSKTEFLARRLEPLHVAAGEEVFRAGDAGDRFYVVAEGEVEVLIDGQTKVEGPGAWFGEIALIRDVPRTATVRARTDAELLALERDDFLAAVTGYDPSREAAESVVAERLGAQRPGIAAV